MAQNAAELYIELLKKTVLYEIWWEKEQYRDIPFRNVHDVAALKAFRPNREARLLGEDWPPLAHSMIGRIRMDQLEQAVKTVLREKVRGDLIETGVWRGGACIFMKGVLQAYGDASRKVWVADSFEGLPPPDPGQYPADAGDVHYLYDYLRVSLEEVQENFRRYGLLDDRVVFLKGWFSETLPSAPIGPISVLRFDGDMYGSTMDVLRNLYDKVSDGGFIIIDDYVLPRCAEAVHEFRRERGIHDPIINIDRTGVYWRKNRKG